MISEMLLFRHIVKHNTDLLKASNDIEKNEDSSRLCLEC